MSFFSLTPQATDWNQIEATFFVGGVPITVPNIKKIKWNTKATPVKTYGAGRKANDYTTGRIEIDDAEVELGWSDWQPLAAAIAAAALLSPYYLSNPFVPSDQLDLIQHKAGQFTVQFSYIVNFLPVTITLNQARVVDIDNSDETGSEESKVSLKLMVLSLTQN